MTVTTLSTLQQLHQLRAEVHSALVLFQLLLASGPQPARADVADNLRGALDCVDDALAAYLDMRREETADDRD